VRKITLGREFIKALVENGTVPDTTTKVIIEASADDVVYLHFTLLGDDSLLEVVPAAAEGAVVKESSWKKIGGRFLWKSESPNERS
jgi:hypothetical protein